MAEGKKGRKTDRTRKSAQNARYRNEGRHHRSHVKRILKHLEREPNDRQVVAVLHRHQDTIGVKRTEV